MKKISKTANYSFNETSDGKLIAFTVDKPIDDLGEGLSFKIFMISKNDDVSFSLEIESARNLLKQLKTSISICEHLNSFENGNPAF